MKEKLFGDASWVEIVLIGVLFVLFATAILSIVTNSVNNAEFFARPITEMTLGEFVIIVFGAGWFARK